MNEPTARGRLTDELEALQARLLEMAGLVERAIGDATDALATLDRQLAKRVREQDDAIDALEVEIDERVVELLALQQPMATDLRQIMMANKISNDLERMGDHAVNIARAVRRLSKTDPLPEIREITEMVTVTRRMISEVLAAYVARDAGAARVVCITDDRVDSLRSSAYRVLVTHMLENPQSITAALELLLVSHNLERVADLATNIAEDVVFLVEGRDIKHGQELVNEDPLDLS